MRVITDKPSAALAKPYPKMDLEKASIAHLLTICILFVIVTLSSCDATIHAPEENANDFHSDSFHVGWLKKSVRLDFVFNLNATIKKNPKPTSRYEANLTTQCIGHNACLFENGKLLRIYKPNQHLNLSNKLMSSFAIEQSLAQDNCSTGQINIYTHCSTHWNPPIHTYGSECHDTIEWHSPINCPPESINHQIPCYAYDDFGKLVDLTRLIKSDGSSYNVSTGNHTSVKDFHLNICNEASELCAPNVSSCYTGKSGLVESGFNNLTSISYENKTFVITSLGEFNTNCTHDRVKTVIKFSCPSNVMKNTGPQLVHSNNCENTVEWDTMEACPLPDIQVPASKCVIQNNELGINIDLKQLTNNQTIVKVPKFMLNNVNYTMMLGLCRGISSASFKCENKSNSATSACLIEDNVSSNGYPIKTNITGSITKSSIRLADNRVYLESIAPNKSCQISYNNNLTVSKPVVTRIEFYCLPTANTTVPNFVAYEDCTYILEWPTPSLCSSLDGVLDHQSNSTQPTKTITNPPSSTQKPFRNPPKTIPYPKPKTGLEKHRETLNEAKLISANTKKVEESSLPGSNAVETTIPANKPMDKRPPLSDHASPAESQSTFQSNRMNNVEKFFMVGLIVMSMGAFIVVIFLLDRRTQDGSPIDRILQPWRSKPSLFVEDTVRGRRRRRDDDGGTIGLIEAEDP